MVLGVSGSINAIKHLQATRSRPARMSTCLRWLWDEMQDARCRCSAPCVPASDVRIEQFEITGGASAMLDVSPAQALADHIRSDHHRPNDGRSARVDSER